MPLLVNGTDLATALLAVCDAADLTWTGDLDPAVAAPPTRASIGFGERLTGAVGVVAARTLTVELLVQAASPAALEVANDLLVATCAGGATGVSSAAVALALVPDGGGNGRQWTGYLAAQTRVTRGDPVGGAVWMRATLVFHLPDPRAVDTTPTVVSLVNNTLTPAPLGTVTVRPVVALAHGAFVPLGVVSLVVQPFGGGANLARLDVSATATQVAAGETVEVDCEAQSVVHVSATGVRAPQNGWLTGGDFFALDPADAIGGNPSCLGIATGGATGGGGGTATATYRRAWR